MINVAIIPARGGSVRIPRKNIRLFCGKPIIAYSIELAIKSGLFDKVIVSTDDQEIANVARKYGAEVPFMRPADLADEHTGTTAVVVHALTELLEQGDAINWVCCIYATAPLLDERYLTSGFNQLTSDPDKNCCFSVTKYNYPIQRSFTINSQRMISPLYPEALAKRSQDLPDVYHDAGQFYWASAETFIDHEADFFSASAIPVILPTYLVQDIDDEEDWSRAELMFKALHNKHDEV